ncbi:MAG: hypothetical protein DSZ05_05160 [Sulfurospirillum sp.]|nr:MAG: hypothetical protein DSZ05_05160 [Sulfurospirillum sp.]
MKIFLFITAFLWTLLSAAELVSQSRLLTSGDTIAFYPRQGESFALTKDFQHYDENANYDIVMKNGDRIYFEEKNQQDDIYIVFNEATDPGDVVSLKVNRGAFTYRRESFDALPQPVKKVLKASAKRSAHRRKKRVAKDALIEEEEFCFNGMGDIVDCRFALDGLTDTVVSPVPTVKKSEEVLQQRLTEERPKERSDGFFSLFSQKIKSALQKITKTLKGSQKAEPEREPVTVKSRLHEKHNEAKRDKEILPVQPVTVAKGDISRYNNLSDEELVAGSEVQVPRFHTLSETVGMVEQFDKMVLTSLPPVLNAASKPSSDQSIQNATVSEPRYQKPVIADAQKFSPLDNLNYQYPEPSYQQDVSPSLHESGEKFAKASRPQIKSSSPNLSKTETPSFHRSSKPALAGNSVLPGNISGSQANMPESVTGKPTFTSKPGVSSLNTKITQNSVPSKSEAPVFTNPSPEASVVRVPIAQEQVLAPQMQPEPSPQMQVEPAEPVVMETPKEEELAPADKIVITKIINKKAAPASQMPIERMSDRILGGGYGDQHATGQVSVKAYSNHKPVSAWVEVFQGKRRVKTFYTGSGKLVRLPEGTYVLRSTYRTGTSKQRKNLGKIHLLEGDVIRKKVYFNVGKLTIMATRNAKPTYVKIEIYKKGSRRRYAYTFSSRRTGKANLQLAEGSYKIVVHEHGNKKVFDNVYIKGNASKTLRVDF